MRRVFTKTQIAPLLIIILYLSLALVYLERYPRVWADESWEATISYSLLTNGEFACPLVEAKGYNTHILEPRLIVNLTLVLFYRLFGFGLVQSRLASVSMGLLTVIFSYYLARELFNRSIALISALFITVDTLVFVASRTVREEIFVAAITVIAVYLFILGVKSGSNLFFSLSGVISGIGLYTHPNTFLSLVSILLLFMIEYRSGVFKKPGFWYFCLFTFVALLPYAIYVSVENYQGKFANFLAQVSRRATPLAAGNWLWLSIKGEIRRFAQYFYLPYRFAILVLVAVSTIKAFMSHRKADRFILTVIFTHVFLFLLLVSNKTVRYLTVLSPFFAILVAKYLFDLLEDKEISLKAYLQRIRFFRGMGDFPHVIDKRVIVFTILAIVFFTNQLAGDIILLWEHRDCDYYGFIRKVKGHIPEKARIWGTMSFWLGLHEHPYRSQYGMNLESFKPEYMILYDTDIWGKTFWGAERKPKSFRDSIVKFAAERGTCIGKVHDKFYGNVEIFRLVW